VLRDRQSANGSSGTPPASNAAQTQRRRSGISVKLTQVCVEGTKTHEAPLSALNVRLSITAGKRGSRYRFLTPTISFSRRPCM
jgi:hypothetical protein